MRGLLYIAFLFLTACKSQIDINTIEQKAHGLSYIKGTNKLVDGEVIRKFENGRIASRESYNNGRPIGNWYVYGFEGETVSQGFGLDAKKYEQKLANVDLTYSYLSINMEGSFAFATLYIDDKNLFDQPNTLVALSKQIFNDYSDKHDIDDILIYDKEREYTVFKSATLNDTFKIDTLMYKGKTKVFIK